MRAAPPLAATPAFDVEAVPALDNDSPHPAASHRQVDAGCVDLPAALGGDPPPKEPAPGRAQALPGWEGEGKDAQALPVTSGEDAGAAGADDDSRLVPRLQSAVARVLPAIETIVARLAAGATHPREMEQAGRALGALTRALRELNGLLDDRRPPEARDGPAGKSATDDEPDEPRDMEEFRQELIRRMNAVVAARTEAAEGGTAQGTPLPSSDAAEEGAGEAAWEEAGEEARDVTGEAAGEAAREVTRDVAGEEAGKHSGKERPPLRGPQVRSL